MQLVELAERLHSAALHLLRELRGTDAESGVPPSQLSALSVLVFGGAKTLGELARIEQVSAPSMSRTIDELEHRELVRRARDKNDRRVVYAVATREGQRLLHAARKRRLRHLAKRLEAMGPDERRSLDRALPLLEGLVRRGDANREENDDA